MIGMNFNHNINYTKKKILRMWMETDPY